MPKIPLKIIWLLLLTLGLTVPAHAQTPTPPPSTFWEQTGQALLPALIGLVFGGILVWVLKPTFEKLGETLAAALSKLGGGWGFRRRYLRHLIEEHRGLNIRGLKTRAPVMVELEQVYISLRARVPDWTPGRPPPSTLTIGQAIAQQQRLAIVGGPGSGKTTLLAYLTLTYARGDARKRLGLAEKRLPILVPLRQLKRILDGAPGNAASKSAASGNASAPGIATALRSRLQAALLDCRAFQSDAALRALFVDVRLTPWRDDCPAADSPAERARRVIALLQGQCDAAGVPALALLTAALQDTVHLGDALHQRLATLTSELRAPARARGGGACALPANAASLSAYLTAWYTDLGLTPRADFFEQQLRRGRCLVLLDGLDEVADEGERRLMAEWVDRLVTLYPQNRYVVTSRPPGYESAPLKNGFTRLDARDFDEDEIRRFAQNWCLAVEMAVTPPAPGRQSRAARQQAEATVRRRAAADAQNLVAAITANADIRALAVNPLLLSIIALVHRYRATLPKRRVDLYAECVDVLLGHWDAARGLFGKLDAGQKQEVLQILALELQSENRREFSRRELLTRVAALLPGVGAEAVAAADFVQEVRERSGLLVEAGLDTYAFSHLTFQEYLTARALVEAADGCDRLLPHLAEEWWQEVILLYAGLTDATRVVKNLSGLGNLTGLLLAGRCVAEAVRLDPATRAEVVTRLETAFEACDNADFTQIGQVLADIEGEDSVVFFLKLAHTQPGRRAAALWALGELGRQPNPALRERALARLLEHFQAGAWQKEAKVVLQQLYKELYTQQTPMTLIERVMSPMVCIPAGEFLYGDEKLRKTLPEFWIDRAPVTQAEYQQFIDANPDHPVPYVDKDWAKPYNWDQQTRRHPPDKSDHPVVLVSWHDAQAYAAWAGKRLPTEEEWEKAARGTDGRQYPWGDEFDKAKCNTRESGSGGTTPVGQYSPPGDSPYGCADMAGNVWEWTDSEWSSTDTDKVLRGGSWNYAGDDARAAYRVCTRAGLRGDNIGFRCSV